MASRSPRLLVVDDEAVLQKLASRHAERAGFEVTIASTAAGALELATTVCPDAILLDLLLPDGSGIDVLARLKAEPKTASIPVVVWSGSDGKEGRSKAIDAGAVDYFEKRELKEIVIRLTGLTRAPNDSEFKSSRT